MQEKACQAKVAGVQYTALRTFWHALKEPLTEGTLVQMLRPPSLCYTSIKEPDDLHGTPRAELQH